jgi:hypothetical protein
LAWPGLAWPGLAWPGLDDVFEASVVIDANDDDPRPSEAVQARLKAAEASRQASFDFLLELHAGIPPRILQYEKVAKRPFDVHDIVSQLGIAPLAAQVSPAATTKP